jgi:pimeloyl-ACP methyl ester carboxylesterase
MHLITVAGGPGGSGIGYLLSTGSAIRQMVGPQYNLVGFDPRGVNNSGPVVDCFPDNPDARTAYEQLFFSDVANASSTSLETQFYSADIFGEWCSATIGQNGTELFISTPLVAQDMLTYAEAEQKLAGKPETDAKVWYFGVSYGTILGATFASLFPDNVGRLILDGVVDAEDYYHNGWSTNLFQADEALSTFSTFCYQSGPNNCSMWGSSPQNISDRLDDIVAGLKYHPIPKTGLDGTTTTGLATYSDLKQLTLLAVYVPLWGFPVLADILSGLENGNNLAFLAGSDLVSEYLLPAQDSDVMIKCVDGYGRSNYTTIEDYEDYVELLDSQSKWFGEVWPNNAAGVLCRSVELQIPEGVEFQGMFPSYSDSPGNRANRHNLGPLPPSSNKTANPILFVSNTIDPVSPIRGYVQLG